MNTELQALYEQDQADRSVFFEQLDHEQVQQVLQRDRARRQRVGELVGSEALQAPEDYFHAAMVFQHGETLEDFWRAHELAGRGAELGHPDCRWLAAAAYDRWLTNQGKPHVKRKVDHSIPPQYFQSMIYCSTEVFSPFV